MLFRGELQLRDGLGRTPSGYPSCRARAGDGAGGAAGRGELHLRPRVRATAARRGHRTRRSGARSAGGSPQDCRGPVLQSGEGPRFIISLNRDLLNQHFSSELESLPITELPNDSEVPLVYPSYQARRRRAAMADP